MLEGKVSERGQDIVRYASVFTYLQFLPLFLPFVEKVLILRW